MMECRVTTSTRTASWRTWMLRTAMNRQALTVQGEKCEENDEYIFG